MAKTKPAFNEKSLTKGELRKLDALRKSLGKEIADEAFSKWYDQRQNMSDGESKDPNVEKLQNALAPYLGKMKFPRGGGYVIKRGRGRFVIEPISE